LTDVRPKSSASIAAISFAIIAAVSFVVAPSVSAAPRAENGSKGAVEIETESTAGISVTIAEEIANVVDDGATRRVLPVVGRGALQNLADLAQLRGIDMAILQSDVLDYARQKQLPGYNSNITYVTKLYNEEFHLLARSDIHSVADLANQKVNFDRRASGTSVTASRVFDLLKVAVVVTNDTQQIALEKLKKGEIAALAFVAGKPAPLFDEVRSSDGLHLLSIPLQPEVTATYLPTKITAADYPDLVPNDQPVDTVAVGTILAVANLQALSDRYRNVSNFVEAFFTEFQSLLSPGNHPKWREVNLAAVVPGWTRFAPADDWLKRNTKPANQVKPDELKQIFESFIEERLAAAGGKMTQAQKDDLFGQFQRWQTSQTR
jgi:TRAP transporter TAXI family solute receptor